MHPAPALIGETFGGTRLDLDHEDALIAVGRWGADVIVAARFLPTSFGPAERR